MVNRAQEQVDTILRQYGGKAREIFVQLAKVSEGSERYDDMCTFMSAVIDLGVDLTQEERILFAVGFKNVAASLRASYRAVDINDIKAHFDSVIREYRKSIVDELQQVCTHAIQQLNKMLESNSLDIESRVLYNKLSGDYHRYIAEVDNQYSYKNKAEDKYGEAWRLAKKSLSCTNCVRLGLVLNWSVFYYEIMQDSDKACSLAKETFDGAINELDELSEAEYKDATLILQLIRDNLVLWRSSKPK